MDFNFDYFSPYNTTDINGWRHSIGLLCQVINRATVQFYFDVQNSKDNQLGAKNKQTSATLEDFHEKMKSSLMSTGKEYSL